MSRLDAWRSFLLNNKEIPLRIFVPISEWFSRIKSKSFLFKWTISALVETLTVADRGELSIIDISPNDCPLDNVLRINSSSVKVF